MTALVRVAVATLRQVRLPGWGVAGARIGMRWPRGVVVGPLNVMRLHEPVAIVPSVGMRDESPAAHPRPLRRQSPPTCSAFG